MRLLLNTSAVALSLPLIFLVGCGGDELGGVFIPDEIVDEEEQLGPKYPVEIGDQIWYRINASYKRTGFADDQSGLTVGEAQSSGHLCLQVGSLQDFATTEFKDIPETKVVAQVKVRGSTGEQSLTYSDQDDASASGDNVDALLAPLWLKKLTVPSANHGYEEPQNVEFNTMAAPLPEGDIRWLPFIDLRETSRKEWSGWSPLGSDEFAGASNYQDTMLNYFRERFGDAYIGDRTKFKIRPTIPPSNCESFPDVTSCQSNQCSWVSYGGAPSACFPLHKLAIVWRDQEEIGGTIEDTLHLLETSYYEDGTLHYAREEISPGSIVPATSNLPSNLPQCPANCFTADVSNRGAFNVDPSYPAPCQF